MRRVLVIALSLGVVGCGTTPPRPPAATPGLGWQDAKLLAEAIDRLQADYVDEVASRALVLDAVRGMLDGLDPNSTYLTPEQFAALDEYTDASMPGAPGAAPAASGATTTPIGAGTGADAVSGAATGSPAPATSAPATDARPTSDDARAASVQGTLPRPALAHLRVFQFNVPTARELSREITRLSAAGPLRGLVLDLRDDSGGVFDAAVETADLFLNDGLIVSSAGRATGSTFERRATPGDLLQGAPIIVLIDGVTASAAEIVAGALQDRGRALVLGSRSFGKGSVQSVFPLRSGGAIKFTTARYRLPSGRTIDGKGIEPDLPLVALDQRGGADPALERALDALAAAGKR